MRRIFPLALAAALGAGIAAVPAPLGPGSGMVAVETTPARRRRHYAQEVGPVRRSKGKQAHPKRHKNRLHISRRVCRKHRKGRK